MPTFTITLSNTDVAAITYHEPEMRIEEILQRTCDNLANSATGRRFNAIVDKIATAQTLTTKERAIIDARLALSPTRDA